MENPNEVVLQILTVVGTAFVLTVVLGALLIPLLRRLKAGGSIREDGPTWHMSKQGTPIMGGLMFIAAIAIVLVLWGWSHVSAGLRGAFYVYGFALVFGAIGFIDDYMKLVHHQNEGLSAGWKFLLQLAAAILFLLVILLITVVQRLVSKKFVHYV